MGAAIGVGAALAAGGIAAASQLGNSAFNWGVQRNLNDQTFEQGLQSMSKQFDYDTVLQQNAFNFNSAEAEKAREWQKLMSDTSFQRQVADMRAAGINPASLSGFAGGASAPSASPASASSPAISQAARGSTFSPGSSGDFGHFISSAVNGMIAKDRDAADYLASEIRDNAKHAHKMEEIRENWAQRAAYDALKNAKFSYENPFDEL